ncbi:hypothetical protein [Dictyobacter kobayashii]|uniref:Uncharacterized protein n=1 Tax=Dictyobacter kobayashii TaxID=2014872 RepID=A0A402ANA1_9CHLR|nr:hypothetical protein [Dictyobacter kobayashii]GCE20562.1 hypothetical protein KDK_43620 [Dictyobacter kobayashii]
MNVPPQPPLGEEPEKQSTLHPAEETYVRPEPNAETVSEGAEQPTPPATTEEDIPTQPVSFSESQAAATPGLEEHEASTLPGDETYAEDGELEEEDLDPPTIARVYSLKKAC